MRLPVKYNSNESRTKSKMQDENRKQNFRELVVRL